MPTTTVIPNTPPPKKSPFPFAPYNGEWVAKPEDWGPNIIEYWTITGPSIGNGIKSFFNNVTGKGYKNNTYFPFQETQAARPPLTPVTTPATKKQPIAPLAPTPTPADYVKKKTTPTKTKNPAKKIPQKPPAKRLAKPEVPKTVTVSAFAPAVPAIAAAIASYIPTGALAAIPIIGTALIMNQQMSKEEKEAATNTAAQSDLETLQKWASGIIPENSAFGKIPMFFLNEKIGPAFVAGWDTLGLLLHYYSVGATAATLNGPSTGIIKQTTTQPATQVPAAGAAGAANPTKAQTAASAQAVAQNTANLKLNWNQQIDELHRATVLPDGFETYSETNLTFLGKAASNPFYNSAYNQAMELGVPVALGTNSEIDQMFSEISLDGGLSKILEATPQPMKAKTQYQMIMQSIGALWTRLGLDELPGTIAHPAQTAADDGTKPGVLTNSMMAFLAGTSANLDAKLGTWPVQMENTTAEGTTENYKIDNISTGMANLATMAAGSAAIGGMLLSTGVNLASSVTQGVAAATKAAGCACAGLSAMGGRTNPICEPTRVPFDWRGAGKPGTTPGTPGGIGKVAGPMQWLNGAMGCFPSTVSEENDSIFDMLRDIRFAAQIIKETNFKKSSDIAKEEERVKEVFDKIKKTNKQKWEKFKDNIKKDDSPLNKGYPVKPKIVERGADGLPKPDPSP